MASYYSLQRRMPFNDDLQEKAERLKSRHALCSVRKSQLKLAILPIRRLLDSPSTTPFTPLKRVPLLANFEEWIRLATDNKINATNSWTVALIDYFYDMSLLKEGNGVNFQRASYTLDGCVKIYTNRVDSIATATGKLLSGLADTNPKGHRNDIDTSREESVKRKQVRRFSFAIAFFYKNFSYSCFDSFLCKATTIVNGANIASALRWLHFLDPRSLSNQNAVSSTWTKLSRGGAKFCCTSPKVQSGAVQSRFRATGNGLAVIGHWILGSSVCEVHVRDSAFSIGEYHGKSGNANFRLREPRDQLRGLRSEAPAPQTEENWASRPLCHT